MKFIQHLPENHLFELTIRGIRRVEFTFTSLRDFLGHEYIRFYTKDPNFKRFTICRDKEIELISELKDGRTFKLGVLDGDMREIPEWVREPVKEEENEP